MIKMLTALPVFSQVTHKQEANLGVKESTLEKVQSQLRSSLHLLEKKRKEVDRLRDELAATQNKCSEQEVRIGANRLVIDKLNDQLEVQAKALEKLQLAREAAEREAKRSELRVEQIQENGLGQRPENTQEERVGSSRNGSRASGHSRASETKRPVLPLPTMTPRRNVDFLLEVEDFDHEEEDANDNFLEPVQNGRPQVRGSQSSPLDDLGHLKNHLFTHIGQRPQLREVNLRTTRTKSSGSAANSSNVMSTGRRMFS